MKCRNCDSIAGKNNSRFSSLEWLSVALDKFALFYSDVKCFFVLPLNESGIASI